MNDYLDSIAFKSSNRFSRQARTRESIKAILRRGNLLVSHRVRIPLTVCLCSLGLLYGQVSSFHPTEDILLSPKAPLKLPGFASKSLERGSAAVLNVSNMNIPKGVTLSIEGYDQVVFQTEGDIVIDGDIRFPGGRLFILGKDRPAIVTGGIDVSGGNGSVGTAGGTFSITGGSGGSGGTPGFTSSVPNVTLNNGAAGFGGGAGGGNPFGAVGAVGGSTNSSGQPTYDSHTYYSCDDTAPGGSAGGSNGTKGANGFGRHTGGAFRAQSAFGYPAVSLTPAPAGGGSGGGGGCAPYDARDTTATPLSAGGGGGGGGGAGGAVVIQAGTGPVVVNSLGIKAKGGNGGRGGNGGALINHYNGLTHGGDGGGGGAGGAGGFIVLQGSTIEFNAGITSLSAAGGSGGAGGAGTAGSDIIPGSTSGWNGYSGAGGGGGRIALYSSWAVDNVAASNGSDAIGDTGGTPTVFLATVTMTPTPTTFVPRTSFAVTDCDSVGGCYQTYTVNINPSSLAGVITFQLSSSALKGFATNYCFLDDCTDPTYDTGRDYIFEGYKNYGFNNPTNQGQTMQTVNAVNSATAIVSSRDFGGSAKLSTTVNIGGILVTAGVTQPTQGSTLKELFARLPVDVCGPAGCRPTSDTNAAENCMTDPYSNCIADAWAAQVSPTRYLDKNEDNEIGAPGSLSRGDGYSAHDEYRAFAYYDGSSTQYARTDPVNTKDVFFWDLAGIVASLRSVLGPATTPGMSFYQIFAQSANLDPNRPLAPDLKKVLRHNRNSIGTNQAFAIVYVDWGGYTDCCGSGSTTLGLTVTQTNDGNDAIRIYNGAIDCFADRFGYSPPLLRARTIAHETGHKLGASHPFRTPAPAYIDLSTLSDVSALGASLYTLDLALNRIYVWMSYYTRADACGGTARLYLDNVANNRGLTVSNQSSDLSHPPVMVTGSDTGSNAIFWTHYNNALGHLGDGSLAPLFIEGSEGLLMDWSADFRITSWFFNPRDLVAMCVKSTCP